MSESIDPLGEQRLTHRGRWRRYVGLLVAAAVFAGVVTVAPTTAPPSADDTVDLPTLEAPSPSTELGRDG